MDPFLLKDSNSCKGKHLVVVAHSEFRGSVYYHHGGRGQCAGRHGAREGAKFYILQATGRGLSVTLREI